MRVVLWEKFQGSHIVEEYPDTRASVEGGTLTIYRPAGGVQVAIYPPDSWKKVTQ